MRTTQAKEQIRCNMKWGNSCTTMSRHCSVCGKGGTGKTPKGGWLDPELCAQARGEEVSSSQDAHGSPQRNARETATAPIKTEWVDTDEGQPGKPDVHARWVAKEYMTHARTELYASTPPLEALKVVLSEVATRERGGKVVALVDVRRAYFHAPSRRRVSFELPPEDC